MSNERPARFQSFPVEILLAVKEETTAEDDVIAMYIDEDGGHEAPGSPYLYSSRAEIGAFQETRDAKIGSPDPDATTWKPRETP